MSGKLILCATPIGNLGDITGRVLDALKSADLIAAEDTRNSLRLLNHFDIRTPMTSYHEYNRIEKARFLIERMKEGGTVALITDAGTPAISDPGEDLVRMCRESGIEVTSLPGACAAVTALSLSGLPTRRFVFEGFLPADKKERRRVLSDLALETRTIVLYEAPHHLEKTLEDLIGVLGRERRIAVCRELTKIHESCVIRTLEEALCAAGEEAPRGEHVLIIEGADRFAGEDEERRDWENLTPSEHVALYEEQGIDRKEALKLAAKDRGLTKREFYRILLDEGGDA